MRNQGGRKKPTSRRIVRKSTFGIYIPADIPQEALDFLNVLKENGSYSNDVVEIIVQYLEVRKFLQPKDPLDSVSGSLLEQVQDLLRQVERTNRTSESSERNKLPATEESLFQGEEERREADHDREEPAPKQDGPGFDLNKTLQRIQRNKQLGAINHFAK